MARVEKRRGVEPPGASPQDAKGGGRTPTVQAVQHAIDILSCFSADEPQLGVTEIARRIGVHKSSVSRLASTLERARLIERDPSTERLRLGVGLIGLAAPLLAERQLTEVARGYLQELAQRSGETAALSIWDGRQGVGVDQALGANAIKHYAPPGRRNPAHCTATGKVLLAFAPKADVERILKGKLEKFTERTIIDADALAAEIERVRIQGYAVNTGEFAADIGAVAAPVRSLGGEVAAAITANVPMYRFGQERRQQLIGMVLQAAAALSHRMGYTRDRLSAPAATAATSGTRARTARLGRSRVS